MQRGFQIAYNDIYKVEVVLYKYSNFELATFCNMDIAFPLLLYRAVEGFNKIELSASITIAHALIYYDNGTEEDNCKGFIYSDYTPSHLTQCEQVIIDCFKYIFEEI